MPKIRLLCFAGLLLVSETAFAANVRLQLEGLTGQLQKNVRAQLSTIQSDEVTPDRRFQARVDDAIREGLKALGYYEPTIVFELRPPPEKGRQVLIARVTAGEPVRIGGNNVILRGGARTDSDYLSLLKKRPAIGTVLNHHDYDSFKKNPLPASRCVKATSTASSTKASWVLRWIAARRSGISIMTAVSVTASVMLPSRARKFATSICKTLSLSTRGTITRPRIWRSLTAASPPPAGLTR